MVRALCNNIPGYMRLLNNRGFNFGTFQLVPPDMRARSLLEDLRTADPLAREIVDRVDRGAYGTKGRRGASIGNNNAMEFGSGDEEGETGGKGKSKASGSSSGPPPNVQGRGRMVELGQEMEMGGLSTAQ